MKRTLLVLSVRLIGADIQAADWAHWRGPEQTGVARDTDLPDRWSPDETKPNNNLIWKQKIGGRSTPLLMDGRVYLINRPERSPRTRTGDVSARRQRRGRLGIQVQLSSTPTSSACGWGGPPWGDPETGNVYAHGTQGLLLCFNKDGQLLWSRSLTEEYGRISGYGGRVTQSHRGRRAWSSSAWSTPAGAIRPAAAPLPGTRQEDGHAGVVVVHRIAGQGHLLFLPGRGGHQRRALLISGGADGAVHAFRVAR